VDTSNREFLNYGEWLHRSRKTKYFSGERILIQEITGGSPARISAASYSETLYHDPGIISCLNISDVKTEVLLSIINSKLISWYNIKTSPKGKRKTFPKVLIGDIRRFPIVRPNPKIQEVLEEIVGKIIVLTGELQSKSNVFLKYLKSSLSIEKPSKKLVNWADLEFPTFTQELNKLLKKSQSLTLSKSDELGWLELFESKKLEICDLQIAIATLDKKIDHEIYKIYGLSEEEIRLIEAYYAPEE